MLISRTLLTVAGVGALALTLASCSADNAGGSGGSAKNDLTWEDSPLSEYWASLEGDEEAQQAKYQEQDKKREDAIAQCMTDEGFEYKPNLTSTTEFVNSGEDAWRPDDKDWVEKYGYGIINNYWTDQEEESGTNPTEDEDPNQKYIESLSQTEQNAYYDAMYGKQSDQEVTLDEDGNEIYEYNWETSGCQGKADHEVNGADMELFEKYEELFTRMDAIYTDAEKAPEMADLNSKWSACMSEAGYSYKTQTEPAEEINKQLDALYAKYTSDEDWADGDPTKEESQAIAKDEVKVALDDLECRNKTDYNDQKLQVQFKLEEQFIKDNKKELDEYKAAQDELMKG